MSGRNWKILDIVLGLIGGICGVLGIISGIKASDYDEQKMFEDLEERYELVHKKDVEAE